MKINLALLAVLVGGVVVIAQEPTFEAASVKANPTRTGIRGHSFPGDRFEARNVPVMDLIMIAYGEAGQPLPESRVTGPSWLAEDRFDVSAKVSGTEIGVPQKQAMLRQLLAGRFHLAVHHESRTMPMYALTLSRKDGTLGPHLHHADVDCEALLASQPGQRDRCILYALPNGQFTLRGQTMSTLANTLTRLLARQVVDRTGLMGGFDADGQFNPEGLPGMSAGPDRTPIDAPSLFTMLEQQLGLKLEATRGPVDVLVVDHADRPDEN